MWPNAGSGVTFYVLPTSNKVATSPWPDVPVAPSLTAAELPQLFFFAWALQELEDSHKSLTLFASKQRSLDGGRNCVQFPFNLLQLHRITHRLMSGCSSAGQTTDEQPGGFLQSQLL